MSTIKKHVVDERRILVSVNDGIAHIVLNRPQKLNALDDEMSDALMDAWQQIEEDPDVAVAILSANGKHFCAGADISGGANLHGGLPGLKQHRLYTGNGKTRFKPVIGVVHGYALGAGCMLALRGCDVIIASPDAEFGYPEGVAGVAVPPPDYLPILPFRLTLELMLLGWKGGRMINAERAFQTGIINAVAPRDRLLEEAQNYAAMLKRLPGAYVRAVKSGLYRALATRSAQSEDDFVDFIAPQRAPQNS